MTFLLLLITVIIGVSCCFYTASALPILTKDGIVSGCFQQTRTGQSVFRYYIPYAKPPIGNRRFRDPEPVSPWIGIKDTCKESIPCLQSNVTGAPVGSEDCLYLDIVRPALIPLGKKLPVVVIFHGGQFLVGSSQDCGPDYLVQEDAISVSIQYRLGIFGFLSTKDEAAYGNWGLKDGRLALRWISRNIERFGGDDQKITLIGGSAGAAFIGYMMSTNTTKGLFSKAILHSGTNLALWSLGRNPVEAAFNVGYLLGINTDSTQTLVNQFRQKSAEELLNAANTIGGILRVSIDPQGGSIFAPVSEPQSNPNAVFTGLSYDIYQQGAFQDIDIIIGTTSSEGNFVYELLRLFPSDYSLFPDFLVPIDLHITNITAKKYVGNLLNEKYFVNCDNSQAKCILQFYNDIQFTIAILQTVRSVSAKSSVYFFYFSYEGEWLDSESDVPGVAHGEDTLYFCAGANDANSNGATAQDKLVARRLRRMWMNFIKSGNPTPKNEPLLNNVRWIKSSASNGYSYMNISNNLAMGQGFGEEAFAYWQDMYETYAVKPLDTF